MPVPLCVNFKFHIESFINSLKAYKSTMDQRQYTVDSYKKMAGLNVKESHNEPGDDRKAVA